MYIIFINGIEILRPHNNCEMIRELNAVKKRYRNCEVTTAMIVDNFLIRTEKSKV